MDFLKQVEFAQTAKKTRLKSDVFQVTAQGGKPGSTLVRNFSLFFQWKMLKMKVSMTCPKNETYPLGLFLASEDEGPVAALFSIHVLTPSGQEKLKIPTYKPIRATRFMEENSSWGFPNFTTKRELLKAKALSDGALTVVCNVECMLRMPTRVGAASNSRTQCPPFPNSPNTLGKKLLADKESCDITILCSDVESPPIDQSKSKGWFTCHKFVLATRSDVFASMFKQNMVERKTSTIKIEDMSSETVALFLDFLYTDKLPPDLSMEQLFSLLTAADKYNIKELEEYTQVQICGLVDKSNISKVLAVAEARNSKMVKDYLASYLSNPKDLDIVFEGGWWKDASPEFLKMVLSGKKEESLSPTVP